MGRESRTAWESALWPRDDRGHACDPTRDSYTGRALEAAGDVRRGLSKKVDWREMGFSLVLQLPVIVGFVLAIAYLPPKVWGVDRVLVALGGFVVASMAWGQVVFRLPFSRAMTVRMTKRYWRARLEGREGAGACLACGYALDGAAVEADGCLQCPECGAAWKADRVRGQHAAET